MLESDFLYAEMELKCLLNTESLNTGLSHIEMSKYRTPNIKISPLRNDIGTKMEQKTF